MTSVKVSFPKTEKSINYRYERAILHPMSQSISTKICILPQEASGIENASQNVELIFGQSFIVKTTLEGQRNTVLIFEKIYIQRKEVFQTSETHFGSFGILLD